LDKSKATQLKRDDGRPLRLDLSPGETAQLPNGLGSVTFEKVVSWQRIQISHTPGKRIALLGVVLALLGLMGSLFIRSRRVWIRVKEGPDGTVVEIAALDRSGGADTDAVISRLVAELQPDRPAEPKERA
jgi:cytochrome c biogenesis protein